MNTLMYLLQKEFRQIFRTRSILAMMFFIPTVQLIILPFAADYEVKNIRVAWIDHDHSTYANALRDKIAASGYFTLVDQLNSFPEGLKLVETGKADLLMEIPADFERNLIREGNQKVFLAVDGINGTKASIGAAYLSRVIADYNAHLDIQVKLLAEKTLSPGVVIQSAPVFWYNPRAEYKYYMVPGILVLLLTLIGGYLTALNIVREKEMGTIEQINVTPIKKWQFILGKLLPFWIVGLVVFTLGLAVMYLVYGIDPEGSLLLLYAFAGVYLIALMGLGLLISTLANTQLQSMFITFFFMMIFILMSGLFTSIESMPDWARWMSNGIPVTHFIKVVRLIVLKGSGLSDVAAELGYLGIFAVVLNALAIWNYRKTS